MNSFSKHRPQILQLGDEFYSPVQAARFPKQIPRFLNKKLAENMGLPLQSEEDWKVRLCDFQAWPENIPTPLALKYHGHQFLQYNPDLGDGRGFLFAQFQTRGKLYDLGTKGSGTTPYSRSGDGRLTLRGAVREVLATELLETYGVHTSRTLCFFETGESLVRGDEPSPTRSAVLTRFSHGHIRIGTFERLATIQRKDLIEKLRDYCLENYYAKAEHKNHPSESFLFAVSTALGKLTAQWMIAGFVHGVLNSDNINITGESFDYGPYRFLVKYDPTFTAAYFDRQGLYSYGRQPISMYWNLQQLAKVLLFADSSISVEPALTEFENAFSEELQNLFFKKLNLKRKFNKTDEELFQSFWQTLEDSSQNFEQFFFDHTLQSSGWSEPQQKSPLHTLLKTYEPATDFHFNSEHPCTLLNEEFLPIWQAIADHDDWKPFEDKIQQIRHHAYLLK